MAMARCLNASCRQALFETTVLDNVGNTALQTGVLHHQMAYDTKSGQLYIRCRYCGAKNGLRESQPAREDERTKLVLDRLLE